MRGWLLDILLCIEQINEEEFSLQDVYEFEDILSQKHPQNKNVKAKIRHQLQLLRDKGGITFLVTATIEYLDNRFCVDSEKPKSPTPKSAKPHPSQQQNHPKAGLLTLRSPA
ncbi:hypothetical protein [Arcanobacterium phocae]